MDGWLIAIYTYVFLAIGSLTPFIRSSLRKVVPRHPGGSSFDEMSDDLLSGDVRSRLAQNESRITGTLGFWKREAEKYRRLNTYVIFWMIAASTLTPVLTQAITEDPYSRWFLTLVASHTTILVVVAKGFKVSEQFRAYRQGESDYYDLRRRLLDDPRSFGSTEEECFENYAKAIAGIRRRVRDAETENFPSVEYVSGLMSER